MTQNAVTFSMCCFYSAVHDCIPLGNFYSFVWAHGIKIANPYELKMLYLSLLLNTSTIQCPVTKH